MDDELVGGLFLIIFCIALALCAWMYFGGHAILYSRTELQSQGYAQCHYWTPFSTFYDFRPADTYCPRTAKLP